MSRKREARTRPEPQRYRIEFDRKAKDGLASLPRPILRRVDVAILGLSIDQHPRGSSKVQCEDGLYRIREGDYRILYRVDTKQGIVLIEGVVHRRDAYRR